MMFRGRQIRDPHAMGFWKIMACLATPGAIYLVMKLGRFLLVG